MSPPTRVLWLIAGLRRGGAERLLCGLAERLDGRFRIDVAHVLGGEAALAERLRAAGAGVWDLGAPRVASTGWIRRLRAVLDQQDPSIIHTHSPLPAAVARAAVPRGPAFVHTEHSPWRQHHPLTRLANAVTYPRNRTVLAVSTAVALGCARAPLPLRGGWPDIEILHHGPDQPAVLADASATASARRLLGLRAETPVIGSVANFEPKKDHETLLRAVALLCESHGPVQCVLVGFGPLESRLRARAAELGLGDVVRFAGSRDDVPALLPAFDVFVHTARCEGFGLAPLEAMAAGVPVVSTAVDGIPEVVGTGGAGVLVAPGDARAVATAVTALLSDPERRARMGAAGRAQAQRFSLDQAARRLERLYDGLLR